MKTKFSHYATLFFLLAISSATAQSKLQREADRLFSKFAYSQAIPLYEKLVVEGSNPNHAHMRLAECYLVMREYEKAIPFFKRFIDKANTPTSYYFKYAMALKSVAANDEASIWLKRYKKFNKNDARVKRLLKEGSLATVVFNSNERYELEPVHFNTEYSEFGGFSFMGNLYFTSNRMNGSNKGDQELYDWDGKPWLDIYQIQENNPTASPRPMSNGINSKLHESSIVFTTNHKNDTIAYFTRNNYLDNKEGFYTKKTDVAIENYNNLKIYKAEKINGEWKATREMKMSSDNYSTGHLSVNTNRTKICFASDKPGGYGGSDIYFGEVHPRGGIINIRNAGPKVNTAGNELFPFINDEGQLFFSSDGHPGFGMLDVFATVQDEDGGFIDVINLGKPLNSEKDDFGYYALANGVDGYVSSNRKGGKGGDDIYKFAFVPSLNVTGLVTDAINAKPLPGVTINLFDAHKGYKITETVTDEQGKYSLPIDRQETYRIEAMSKTHPKKKFVFETLDIGRTTKKLERDIVLEPVMDVKLLAGLNKIYYDYNKSDIRPDAALELDKVVKLMMETYPELVIRLEAHTDPVGGDTYNKNLSQARAESCFNYLISKGVPEKRILSFEGFGESRPINDCNGKHDCSDEELELNRRTEFPIIQFISKPDLSYNSAD